MNIQPFGIGLIWLSNIPNFGFNYSVGRIPNTSQPSQIQNSQCSTQIKISYLDIHGVIFMLKNAQNFQESFQEIDHIKVISD